MRRIPHTIEHQVLPKTLVVCVGSGTICSGILNGILSNNLDIKLIGVMSRTGNVELKKQFIFKKSRVALIHEARRSLVLEDHYWKYTEPCTIRTPFPCHSYYDKKAWKFLTGKVNNFEEPVLFWNIGSSRIIRRNGDGRHGLL